METLSLFWWIKSAFIATNTFAKIPWNLCMRTCDNVCWHDSDGRYGIGRSVTEPYDAMKRDGDLLASSIYVLALESWKDHKNIGILKKWKESGQVKGGENSKINRTTLIACNLSDLTHRKDRGMFSPTLHLTGIGNGIQWCTVHSLSSTAPKVSFCVPTIAVRWATIPFSFFLLLFHAGTRRGEVVPTTILYNKCKHGGF